MKIFLSTLLLLSVHGVSSTNLDSKLLREGEFETVTRGDDVSGDLVIVENGEGRKVLKFKKNFKSASGPDLFVAFHTDVYPDKYTKKNSYIVSKLKKNKGAQSYLLPKDLDLEKFNAVLIYCKKFHVTFGTAKLQ